MMSQRITPAYIAHANNEHFIIIIIIIIRELNSVQIINKLRTAM